MKKRKWIILSSIVVFALLGISMIYLTNKRRENMLQGSFTINQQEYVMGEGKGISLNLPDYTDEAETEEGKNYCLQVLDEQMTTTDSKYELTNIYESRVEK
ncbi:MAG: hypothetical protein HDR01_04475 [Lachnospiraceae bacterium]|nr:hypothetical protein [Lachnospiraceae bacterium]